MNEFTHVYTGLTFPESPRWHDGRLWVADWGASELVAITPDGVSEIVTRVESFPFSIDWLPDGRLLVISAAHRQLFVSDDDGKTLLPYRDVSAISEKPWNEIVSDARGYVYVNNIGFDFPGGEFAPGFVAVVPPNGEPVKVADGFAFPNGMAITDDGTTLIVAESYANCLTALDIASDGSLSNRRTWADLGTGVPDGICIDEEGAVWVADVPNQCCTRVHEGGMVSATVKAELGCFACMLGGTEGRTLYVVANQWGGTQEMSEPRKAGQVLSFEAPARHAGRP
jgi:sugar lactone lactonase YvrE